MPTGYTSEIYHGKSTSLRDFAFNCAHGFLVGFRDHSRGEPFPQQLKAKTEYYDEKLAELEKQRALLNSMSDDELAAESALEAADDVEYCKKRVLENEQLAARYDEVRKKVEQWENGPAELKTFMLQQLKTAKEFDVYDEPLKYHTPVKAIPGAEYRRQKLQEIAKEIEYQTCERAKEIALVEKQNAWLHQLWSSLNGIA